MRNSNKKILDNTYIYIYIIQQRIKFCNVNVQNLRIYERSLCRGSILDLTWQNSIRSSISLGLGNITFIYGHRTRAIVETRQTEDGKGEMGSRARSWGGLLCTWPTCGTPAVTREGIEAFARISSRFWPRTESEVPWIFPIRDEILRRDLSFSLSLSLPSRKRPAGEIRE